MLHAHYYEPSLIVLSVIIAIFASYTALDLANAVTTSRGWVKALWLLGGSLAMGVGIWSMHFVGMLAFHAPGLSIYYDVPLVLLSTFVAVVASALALSIVAMRVPTTTTFVLGGLIMGAAIAGMHYIGIWSMEMPAKIIWDYKYVALSILIAFVSSFTALYVAFRLRDDLSLKGFLYRGAGGVLMGFAISGMHYTGMMAMKIVSNRLIPLDSEAVLATDGLAAGIIIGTLVILGIALTGSNIERALSRKTLVNETLQASLKARDDFFSIVSHELRTPLTSIKLQNDLMMRTLAKGDGDREKMVSQLEKNGYNIDRINRLVEDMLDISRISTSRLSLQKEEFNLTGLIHEVVERLRPVLESSGSSVDFDDSTNITGQWDRFRIEQVITNLLTNAAKYAPGTTITIRLSIEDNMACLRVADEGKGIPIEDQERIFRRFERATGAKNAPGLGLGLFITREIIHMHQGEIKVNSRPDEGAEFIACLPLESQSSQLS